jgi:hypothetical protein
MVSFGPCTPQNINPPPKAEAMDPGYLLDTDWAIDYLNGRDQTRKPL